MRWQPFQLVAPAMVLCILLGTAVAEEIQRMPVATDLRMDAAGGRPLLLMFGATDCEFCNRLESREFIPLLRSGEYEGRIVMRRLDLDESSRVRDFAGKSVSSIQLAASYDARVTPTVLLLDVDGRELSRRLIGPGLADFYGAYLDRAIRKAEATLGTQPPAPTSF